MTMKPNNNLIRLEANYASPTEIEGEVIKGCSICTAGPALGHGVYLDESFILEAYQLSDMSKLGLKARFGHPSMCNEALGTAVGRFTNFAISKDGKQLYGDLKFGEYADERYKKHIIGLAKEDPEAFGTSIVFSIGSYYRKSPEGEEVDVDLSEDGRETYEAFEGDPEELSEELYVRCGKMYGCDFVDEPAANPGGLFSSASPAHEVSQFLSENPEIKTLLQNNKNVVDIIEKYGVQIKQFLSKEEIIMNKPENEQEELLEANSDIEDTNCIESEVEDVELESAEEEVEISEDEVEAMSIGEYKGFIENFGLGIADEVLASGALGSEAINLAQSLELVKLTSENEILKSQVSKLREELADVGNDVASFQESRPAKRSLTKNVKL